MKPDEKKRREEAVALFRHRLIADVDSISKCNTPLPGIRAASRGRPGGLGCPRLATGARPLTHGGKAHLHA